MKAWLSRLLEHMDWADATVIESLHGQGASSKAVGIMGHIVAAESLWLARTHGAASGAVPVWPQISLSGCLRLVAENAKGFGELLEPADERALSRPIAYANSKGERFESRLDDVLLHVFMHGSYHRGQLAQLQRMEGHEPAYTDFIHYVRAVRGRS